MGDDEKLIDANIVARRLGLTRGRMEVYAWMRTANPPPAYRIGKQRLRFRFSEVLEWLKTRAVR